MDYDFKPFSRVDLIVSVFCNLNIYIGANKWKKGQMQMTRKDQSTRSEKHWSC